MKHGKLDKIKDYLEEITPNVEKVLGSLESLCIKGRDRIKDPIPLYLTKWRVKKPESVYLKTKRKGKKYTDVTDYGGLRLLCLFEKDILKVHDFLLGSLSSNEYDLHECYAYNWDSDSDSFYVLDKSTSKYFAGYSLTSEEKDSGYKSIHYLVVAPNKITIEIQLRTLVQDVWGELEHALSYKKGSVHPHIKKSFSLLSKDLQNIDDLFSHLRDISEKEKGGEAYSNYKVGPKCHFMYEDDLIPQVFSGNTKISEIYNQYWGLVSAQKVIDINALWVGEARKYLNELNLLLGISSESGLDDLIKYWYNMEDAYMMFCEARYDEAIQIYMSVLETHDDKYCVFYRLGEIYFIKGEHEIALSYFDEAEDLLDSGVKNVYRNHFMIKSKLALIYWYLGEEYLDIALQEILEAEEIYVKYSQYVQISEEDYLDLINNICWYMLERYIIQKRKKKSKGLDGYFTDVSRRFKELERIAPEKDAPVYVLDTFLWYYYYKYLRTKQVMFLHKAKDCALQMKEKKPGNLGFKIMNMHINHIQEVMQYAQYMLDEKE